MQQEPTVPIPNNNQPTAPLPNATPVAPSAPAPTPNPTAPTDYGKMIDEALKESLPGADFSKPRATQTIAGGMGVSASSAPVVSMEQKPAPQTNNTWNNSNATNQDFSEADALNIISDAKKNAEKSLFDTSDGSTPPKIITGGGVCYDENEPKQTPDESSLF